MLSILAADDMSSELQTDTFRCITRTLHGSNALVCINIMVPALKVVIYVFYLKFH